MKAIGKRVNGRVEWRINGRETTLAEFVAFLAENAGYLERYIGDVAEVRPWWL